MLSKIAFLLLLASLVVCERPLPTNTQPLSYYLSLTSYIHEEDYSFFGFVDIKIRALDTTDTITVHAENLDDLEVTLTDNTSDPPTVYHNLTYVEDKENDFLRIETPAGVVLQEGKEYTLKISFMGEMTNDSFGFYKMDFADSENRKVVLAATQFENVFARRVFPCYDHPMYKAKFTIVLTHGREFKAYSNMPQDGPTVPMENENLVTTKFQETPRLPTYTLAFLLAKGYKEYELETPNSSVRQRLLTENHGNPKNIRLYGNYVSEAFRTLEEYFGPLKYLPKIDHVSIPNTISGGMENWGLIVYNTIYFELNDVKQANMEIAINSVLAHELSHMWFGNTITTKDWKNIWMTESLATLYGWRVFDNIKPDWGVSNYSIRSIYDFSFMNPTSLSLSRHYNVKNITNFELYDYYKGCSLLKMIESVLSKKTMDKAMRNLINRYRYSNYDEDDLLAELQIAATEDKVQLFDHPGSIERVFKSWFHKPYYPIVTVTRSYDNGDLTISQHSSQSNETHLWDVPVNFATPKDPNFENVSAEYLLPKVSILTLPGNGKFKLSNNDWLIMNKQQTGHYVVNYDQHNWEIIAETLAYNHESIHYLNRAQIVRDILILHSKDLITLDIAFDILSYMSQETDLTVWRSARDTFLYFNNLLKGGKAEEKYQQFLRDIMKDILEIVKIQNSDPQENPILSATRILLLELACEIDYEDCLIWAKNQFESYLNRRSYFDTSAIYTILFNGPKLIDNETFKKAVNKLLFDYGNEYLYVGLLQNENLENVKNILDETLEKRVDFISSAYQAALLRADFDTVGKHFIGLSKKNQNLVLDTLFGNVEKDNIEYSVISRDSLSADNLKKVFNDKLFALFQISEENLSTIPNYRLNPHFVEFDDAALEWFNEYELSLVYPTEESVDITTPEYEPNEEEATFSTIFVPSEEDIETSTKAEDYVDEHFLETTTQSNKKILLENLSEEEDSSQIIPTLEEEKQSSEEFTEKSANKDQKENPILSSGMLFRGLSFLTFMVVPFVILI